MAMASTAWLYTTLLGPLCKHFWAIFMTRATLSFVREILSAVPIFPTVTIFPI